MVKFFKIIEKIVYGIAALAIVAALAMMIIGAFVNLDKVEKELLSYMPYFYICATIVLLYKIVVLVFTSFYQIKIEKRKDYLDVILALQRAEEASTKQEDMLEQELTPFIENVKRLPEGNTDAVIREIQDRLPEVVQKLVDQRVAEIKQNIAKENDVFKKSMSCLQMFLMCWKDGSICSTLKLKSSDVRKKSKRGDWLKQKNIPCWYSPWLALL